MQKKKELGILVTCGDRRFRRHQEDIFSQKTGLSPQDFWVHSLAGGAGRAFDDDNLELENYAVAHGATVMGWGMHGDHCGGYPGLDNKALREKLEEIIKKAKEMFPDLTHYGLWSEGEPPNQETIIWELK